MAEEEEKKEKQNAAPEKEEKGNDKPDKSSKKKMMVIGGIIAVVLLIQIATAFFFVNWVKGKDPAIESLKRMEEQKRAEIEKLTKIGAILEEPIEITVNIAGSDGEHYLKSSIQLEWDEEKNQGLREAITARRAKIMDIVINLISTQSKEDLSLSSGKQRVRESIRGEINRILPRDVGQVENVFFQEFIIQ